MPSQEDINQQTVLLEKHRQTLFIYLEQQAALGTAHTPPGVIHGIRDARTHIRYIKQVLRNWKVDAPDKPYDEDILQLQPDPPNLAQGKRTVNISPGTTSIARSLDTAILSMINTPLTNTVFVANDKGVYHCAENGEATFEVWGEIVNGLAQPIYDVHGTIILYDIQDNKIPITWGQFTAYPGSTNFIESRGRRPFQFIYKAPATTLPSVKQYETTDLQFSSKETSWVRLPFEIRNDNYHIVVLNTYQQVADNPGTITTLYDDSGAVMYARFGMSSACQMIYPEYACRMGLLLCGEEGKPFTAIAFGKLRQ
jgi:hypothetical protein